MDKRKVDTTRTYLSMPEVTRLQLQIRERGFQGYSNSELFLDLEEVTSNLYRAYDAVFNRDGARIRHQKGRFQLCSLS